MSDDEVTPADVLGEIYASKGFMGLRNISNKPNIRRKLREYIPDVVLPAGKEAAKALRQQRFGRGHTPTFVPESPVVAKSEVGRGDTPVAPVGARTDSLLDANTDSAPLERCFVDFPLLSGQLSDWVKSDTHEPDSMMKQTRTALAVIHGFARGEPSASMLDRLDENEGNEVLLTTTVRECSLLRTLTHLFSCSWPQTQQTIRCSKASLPSSTAYLCHSLGGADRWT